MQLEVHLLDDMHETTRGTNNSEEGQADSSHVWYEPRLLRKLTSTLTYQDFRAGQRTGHPY